MSVFPAVSSFVQSRSACLVYCMASDFSTSPPFKLMGLATKAKVDRKQKEKRGGILCAFVIQKRLLFGHLENNCNVVDVLYL